MITEDPQFVRNLEALLIDADPETWNGTEIELLASAAESEARPNATTLTPRINQTWPNSLPPTTFKLSNAPTPKTTARPLAGRKPTLPGRSRAPTVYFDWFNVTLPSGTGKPLNPTVKPSARPINMRPTTSTTTTTTVRPTGMPVASGTRSPTIFVNLTRLTKSPTITKTLCFFL